MWQRLIPNHHRAAEMLKEMGLASMDELFSDIPAKLHIGGISIPAGKGEMEVRDEVEGLARLNRPVVRFLGGGAAQHYVPAAVNALVSRGEFLTAYTPYQAEVSQGMLQALFEFQSLVCELTGLDAANSSMYDGATAAAEAALMCRRITGKRDFVVPRALSWEERSVMESYLHGQGMRIVEVPWEAGRGTLDLGRLRACIGPETAGVLLKNPNSLGVWEERAGEVRAAIGDVPLVVSASPLSLAVAKPPADYGADIVVGDGLELGLAPSFGGPSFGLFACRKEHIRAMPGRVVGLTSDALGRRAFTLTLQAREQHIRRSKATSNICTNEALCALASTVYLAVLGADGFRAAASASMERAHSLCAALSKVDGITAPLLSGPFFTEFTLGVKFPVKRFRKGMVRRGYDLGPALPFSELGNALLAGATEVNTPEQVAGCAAAAAKVIR